MPDYQKLYLQLFNKVTDTIEFLQQAQRDSEKLFIESEDFPIEQIERAEKNADAGKRPNDRSDC